MHVCDPPFRAWDRLKQALISYSEVKGIDLHIARPIPRMLRNAGLDGVEVNPLIHIYGPDHTGRPILVPFANSLRDRVVVEGLISEAESAECISSLERHLGEPETLVVSHLFVQAWGRKR